MPENLNKKTLLESLIFNGVQLHLNYITYESAGLGIHP